MRPVVGDGDDIDALETRLVDARRALRDAQHEEARLVAMLGAIGQVPTSSGRRILVSALFGIGAGHVIWLALWLLRGGFC